MKHFRRKLLGLVIRIFFNVSRLWSWSFGQKLGTILGYIAYYLLPKYRQIVQNNLAYIFPDRHIHDRMKLARQVFVNQGKSFFELLFFPKLNQDNIKRLVQFKGKENIERGLSRGKGVLILSAHFGNWELLGATLSLAGFPINVIARKVYIEDVDRLLVYLREAKGMKVISRGERESAKYILKALRRNEAIGILIDQNTKSVPGINVDFLGKPAYTPMGLAVIAMKSSAAVVPGFIYRKSNGTHQVELCPPVELVYTGNYSEDVKQNTYIFNQIIGSYIKRYPEQWVWFHKRWENK